MSSTIYSGLKGAGNTDLVEHIISKMDVAAEPMLKLLKDNLHHPKQDGDVGHSVWNFHIQTSSGTYTFEMFQKEPNMYSGAVKLMGGESIQNFDNQPVEIIASILHAKIGNPLPPPPSMDDLVAVEVTELIGPATKEEELRHRINANGIDSLLETPDHELVEKLMNDEQKPKVEIKFNENNELTITLYKSTKESDMGFGDELKKAFGKPDEKKDAAKKPADKKPQENEDDVLSEVEGDEEDQNPAENSSTHPQDDMDSTDDMVNQPGQQKPGMGQMQQSNQRPQPMGGDDQNSLPGANLGGNTGGKKAQNLAAQGQDQMSQPMGTEGMLQDMQLGDNHEYVKMSSHAAGKQYWYRDPMTGQIIEKDNAPEGHPDYDHSMVLQQLIQKVDQLSQQLQSIAGDEGMSMDPMSGDQPMMQDGMEGNDDGSNIEQMEEQLGQDLDGDNEEGEDPAHQEAVLGDKNQTPQEDEQQAAAPKAAPQAGGKPAAKPAPPVAGSKTPKDNTNQPKDNKPKPDFDKMKKSLKAKYPTLSDEKLESVLQKAMAPNEADIKTISSSDMKPTEGDIGPTGGSTGSDDEGNTKTKKKDIKEEGDLDGDKGGEPANKKDNAFEKIRKSKFDRMWTVFKIDMPESLAKSEDQAKANEGLKKLQKCIMKQGKSEAEANKIVNRAVAEKYDLFGKGKKFFANHAEFTGAKNYNQDGNDHSLEKMSQLRKSDADSRFSIKEYTEGQEVLVGTKESGVNEQIAKSMKPQSPDWSEFKEFRGEKIQKSTPSPETVARQAEQDSRWNVPAWSGKERDIKQMTKSVPQSINERIAKSSEHKDVKFDGPEFNEEKVKLQKSVKTDSEKMAEAVIKKNWKE